MRLYGATPCFFKDFFDRYNQPMLKKPENPIPIGSLRLRIGVYVWVDLPWSRHSFIVNQFLITTDEELRQLRALGSNKVYWVPSKSKVEPGESYDTEEASPESLASAETPNDAPLDDKKEKLERQRALINKATQEWKKASSLARESLLGLRDNPRQAGAKMRNFTQSAAASVSNGEALLHLLGESQGEGPQYHALNCMTMAILLAKSMGLPTAVISEIAIGALAHDIGSTLIPARILRSNSRNKAEENLYRDHCRLGVDLARASGAFSEGAISALQDHHEAMDGSGFPSGKKGVALGLAARIVAVVSHYDRLCNPASPDAKPMMPAEALKKMWVEEQSRLDPTLITALVKLLGVYPPGTIVQLNDGSLGLVVSPGKSSLAPKVLIYDPDLPKEEAPVVDLGEVTSLSIEVAPNLASLPEEALMWLNPRANLSYYFTADDD